MKLWTVSYNDDYGLSAEICTSEEQANDCAAAFIAEHWYPELGELPEDWRDAMEKLRETVCFIDSVHIDEHEVPTPEPERDLIDEIIIDHVPGRSDGDLEIDENLALVSHGEDPGAYVQCWKWVPFDGIDEDMVLITPGGTVWYFDLFVEFMSAHAEAPKGTVVKRGTPELLEKSEGVNDSEEFFLWLEKEERA